MPAAFSKVADTSQASSTSDTVTLDRSTYSPVRAWWPMRASSAFASFICRYVNVRWRLLPVTGSGPMSAVKR